MKKTFAELFKKYRLRAEFEKLSDLGNALAEKGLIYEDSLFSHWQKGNRTPHNRITLLALICIFVEKKAIISLDEANEFLASAYQGYLTKEEITSLSLYKGTILFQIPREIAHFTGRKKILQQASAYIRNGGVLLINGPSGIGKTALAIHIGHILRKSFPDGILWYKVDTTHPMDILLSIAQMFHENLNPIQDIEVRAAFVRSLLAHKKILLIFDNVDKDTKIRYLLPNSLSSVILTSQYSDFHLDCAYEKITLESFTEKETILLFGKILPKKYVMQHKENLLKLSQKIGYSPLALQIYAKQIVINQESPEVLLQRIRKTIPLKMFIYEDKDLYTSIDISYSSLEETAKKIFLSLGVFEGKDFSLEAVGKINNLHNNTMENILEDLKKISLIERSADRRYRLHPIIKNYIRSKKLNKRIYQNATKYFIKFIEKNKYPNILFYNLNNVYPELDNIMHILHLCSKYKDYHLVLNLWKHLGMFFYQTGDWKKILTYGEEIYNHTIKHKQYYNSSYVEDCIDILARIYYFQGNQKMFKKLLDKELEVAKYLQDNYLIAFSNIRRAKLYQYKCEFHESIKLLSESISVLEENKDNTELAYAYKFMGEAHMYKKNYSQALECFKKACHFVKQSPDIMLSTIISSTIGHILYIKNEFRPAEELLKEGIATEKKYSVRIGISILNNLALALIEKKKDNMSKSRIYLELAKRENQYLNLHHQADKIFAIISLLKNDLQEAGYYIFA